MWTQKNYVWRTPKCDGTLKCNGTTTSDSLPKTPMFWLDKVRWSACIRIFFAQHMYTSLFSQFPGVKTFPSYHCWFLQLVSFPHRVDSEYVAAMSPMTSPWRGVTYIFRQHRRGRQSDLRADYRALALTIGLWGLTYIYRNTSAPIKTI